MEIPDGNVRYVDLPELAEVFADYLGLTTFDGHVVRTEFLVTRADEPSPSAPISARRYPACRLVLSSQAAVQLHNQLAQIVALMVKKGLVKLENGKPVTKQ